MKKWLVIGLGIYLLGGSTSFAANWLEGVLDSVPDVFHKATKLPQQAPVKPAPKKGNYQQNQYVRLTDKKSVADAQNMLNQLGYNVGAIDGLYGKNTAIAIKSFQRNRGMHQDGYVTLGLLNALMEATSTSVAANSGVGESEELAQAQKEDKQQGMVVGTTIGAGLGLALSDKIGVSKGEGAVIGGAVGLGAGYIVGNETASKRGEYANRYDEIDLSIQETDKRITSLNSRIALMGSNVRSRDNEIRSMKERAKNGENVIAMAQEQLTSLSKEIETMNGIAKDTKVAIKIVEDDLADLDSARATEPNNQQLERRRDELVKRRDDLIVSLNTINGIEPKLEEQKAVLNNLSLG